MRRRPNEGGIEFCRAREHGLCSTDPRFCQARDRELPVAAEAIWVSLPREAIMQCWER